MAGLSQALIDEGRRRFPEDAETLDALDLNANPIPQIDPEEQRRRDLIEEARKRNSADPTLFPEIGGIIERATQLEPELDPEKTPAFRATQRRMLLQDGSSVTVDVGELEDFRARFDTSRSDEFLEQIAKLNENPRLEGFEFRIASFKDVNDNPQKTIIFREPGSDIFKEVDTPDKIFSLGDIADILGFVASEQGVGSVAAAIGTAKGGFLQRILGQFLGVSVGTGVQAGVESARGFEFNTTNEIFDRAVQEGTGAALGEGLFALLGKPVSAAVGRGVVKDPALIKANVSARELGLPEQPAITTQPALAIRGRQAASTTTRGSDLLMEAPKAALDFLESVGKALENPDALSDEALVGILSRIESEILSTADGTARSVLSGGDALVQGREVFTKGMREFVNRRYKAALNFDGANDVFFDVTDARAVAKKMLEGTPIRTGEGLEIFTVNSETRQALEKFLRVDDTVQALSSGQETDTVVTAFEQMIALRSSFFDLKNAPVGETGTVSNGAASQVWSALTKAIDNPQGGPAGARQLFRKAAASNRLKERITERAIMRDIARSAIRGTQDTLFANVVRPGGARNLSLLKSGILKTDPQEWSRFQDAVRTGLLAEPEKIPQFIAKFRAEGFRTLKVIFPEDEISNLQALGQQAANLKSGAVRKQIEKQVTRGDRALNIVQDGNVEELGQFIIASGGKDSPQARELQRGIFMSLIQSSRRIGPKGERFVDKKAFGTQLDKLRDDGKLSAIFTEEQIQRISKIDDYISVFNQVSGDTASAIRAGSVASGILPGIPTAKNLWKALGAYETIVSDFMISTNLLRSDSLMNRVLLGQKSGQASPAITVPIRVLLDMTTLVNAELEREQK